ncbi:MAG: HAD-IC family P-type ATPase [Opitutae bacterium]|nr:HAD-IC family P-type ATPase [Opitutae bacterium]
MPLQTDAARSSGFCCAGCSYVHRLVHEHGLEGYYRIKDAVIAPVDPWVFQPRDFTWLAEMQTAAEAEAKDTTSTAELTLEVQGISCAGCVWLIEKVFHRQPGALSIETDAQLGRIQLRWARGQFDAPAFARALQSFNYLVGPPGEEPAVPESRLLVRRIGVCAAFAMNVMLFTLPAYFGMEATFPYARLFGTLSLLFATLSLLTGGSYFLSRAVQALRSGVMHIDLPIAVGIVGAYAGSLYGWLSGREAFVYFDFVAAFILLMLVGRWAQVAAVERNRRRLLSAPARPHKVNVVAGSAVGEQPVEALMVGDILEVRSGQIVPVESQLENAAATCGTSWITGEAEPRTYAAGQRVPAGALNLGHAPLRLRAVEPWRGSLLAQLLRPVARDAYRHRFLERVIGGYLVAIFVVAAATGLGWWVATHDAAHTWAVVTAVLVVSCPCAIGLAFPLADEMATVALRRHGVFVREGELWPKLARIRKIVFDKTGTLTLETPALASAAPLRALSPTARAALAALVRDNAHPVSQCLHENLLALGLAPSAPASPGTLAPPAASAAPSFQFRFMSAGQPAGERGLARASAPTHGETVCARQPESPAPADSRGSAAPAAPSPDAGPSGESVTYYMTLRPDAVTDVPGYGVTLRGEDGLWSLGRPGWRGGVPGQCHLSDDTFSAGGADGPGGRGEVPARCHLLSDISADAELACDGVVLARFEFTEAVRPDARAEIAALKALGLRSYILSGDRPEKVAAMAASLGIAAGDAVAGATPTGKAAWVQQLDERDTLMLGDGANDSLAFEAAFARGTPVVHRGVLAGKADFYYLGRGLAGIRRLFEVNAARRRTQAWLLGFSVAYNVLAVGLAAAGHMSPLLAAVLMPVSSLVTLAIVAGGMRGWLRG